MIFCPVCNHHHYQEELGFSLIGFPHSAITFSCYCMVVQLLVNSMLAGFRFRGLVATREKARFARLPPAD